MSMSNEQVQQCLPILFKLLEEGYTIVTEPQIQSFMSQPWFDDEAILDVTDRFGKNAYFVPTKYLVTLYIIREVSGIDLF